MVKIANLRRLQLIWQKKRATKLYIDGKRKVVLAGDRCPEMQRGWEEKRREKEGGGVIFKVPK